MKEKPKRKNKKRKQEIINNLEEKAEEKQEEKQEEAPSKRIKITKDVEQQEESEPSLWRGAILKPAMLGILAAGSFYVNHMFNTSKPKFRSPPPAPAKPQQKKKYFDAVHVD